MLLNQTHFINLRNNKIYCYATIILAVGGMNCQNYCSLILNPAISQITEVCLIQKLSDMFWWHQEWDLNKEIITCINCLLADAVAVSFHHHATCCAMCLICFYADYKSRQISLLLLVQYGYRQNCFLQFVDANKNQSQWFIVAQRGLCIS